MKTLFQIYAVEFVIFYAKSTQHMKLLYTRANNIWITYLFRLLRQNSENTLVISLMFWYIIAGAKLKSSCIFMSNAF